MFYLYITLFIIGNIFGIGETEIVVNTKNIKFFKVKTADPHIKEGTFKYIKGEILNIKYSLYNKRNTEIKVTMKKDNKIIFQITESAKKSQLMLNMNYYEGVIWIYFSMSGHQNENIVFKLCLIPLEDIGYKNVAKLTIDGSSLGLFQANKDYLNKYEYIYKYIYQFSQTIHLCCEKIYSNGMQLELINYLDYSDIENNVTEKDNNISIALNINDYRSDFPAAKCIIKHNSKIVEKHEVIIIFEALLGELVILGLPVNQTLYQVSNYAYYMFNENEVLTLTCSVWQYEYYTCRPIKWIFQDTILNVGKNAKKCNTTQTFFLNQDYDGKNISCFNQKTNVSSHVFLIMKRFNTQTVNNNTTATIIGVIIAFVFCCVALYFTFIAIKSFKSKNRNANTQQDVVVYNTKEEVQYAQLCTSSLSNTSNIMRSKDETTYSEIVGILAPRKI